MACLKSSEELDAVETEMEEDEEEGNSVRRRWEDLNIDILVKISQYFDIFERTSGLAHVCRSWRSACCDPFLWKTLDLSWMKSNFIKTPMKPYVYVDSPSDKLLTRMLKLSLSLSHGAVETLVFHYHLFVSDEQLVYTAERSPHIRRVVLPAWNRIKKSGIVNALSHWKNLESLTMPSISSPSYLMEEIARNCKNFRELKVMGLVDTNFASAVVSWLPNLKVLSVRCTMLGEDALRVILDGLHNLEVLNISHCLIVDAPPHPAPRRIVKDLDQAIIEQASFLREFLFCTDSSCIMCQRTKDDEGIMRWYKYEEGLWKADEASSLHLDCSSLNLFLSRR